MAGTGWTNKKIDDVVAEERTELGAFRRAWFDPYALAEHHGLECIEIGELPDEFCRQAAVQHFLQDRQAAWSAALVPLGSARIILENNSHSMVRRRASVSHELGHFLLEHDFDDVVVTMLASTRMRLGEMIQLMRRAKVKLLRDYKHIRS